MRYGKYLKYIPSDIIRLQVLLYRRLNNNRALPVFVHADLPLPTFTFCIIIIVVVVGVPKQTRSVYIH